jgi:hypothetical protein
VGLLYTLFRLIVVADSGSDTVYELEDLLWRSHAVTEDARCSMFALGVADELSNPRVLSTALFLYVMASGLVPPNITVPIFDPAVRHMSRSPPGCARRDFTIQIRRVTRFPSATTSSSLFTILFLHPLHFTS